MKFIADAMLGRLAKRLRLLGYDVLYDPAWDDNEIIRRSLEQDRTILTRDAALASRPLASRCLLIRHDRVSDQIRQVRAAVKIDDEASPLTRCSVCNALLEAATKMDVADQVPEQVLRGKTDFLRCMVCGRIYWKGSHVRRMRADVQGNSGRPDQTGRPHTKRNQRK